MKCTNRRKPYVLWYVRSIRINVTVVDWSNIAVDDQVKCSRLDVDVCLTCKQSKASRRESLILGVVKSFEKRAVDFEQVISKLS